MSGQTWEEVISVLVADGMTITAASEALIVPDVSIPANYMYPGRVLRGRLWGKSSQVITTPGTLQVRIRWGGLAGTLLADSGAMTTRSSSASTNETWSIEFDITCRAVGTAGSFVTFGRMERRNKLNASATDAQPDLIPASGPAAVTVDTSIAKLLSITFTPSVATGSHTAMGYILESTN